MIKKLPINVPLITSSPTIAALFTIITGVDFLDGWVVNNFNNLLYIENAYESRCIFMEDQPNCKVTIFNDVGFLKFNTLKSEIVNLLNKDIIDFIIKVINEGYFIRMAVDNYYIRLNKKAYMKRHCLHPLFIYGYDTKQRCLLIGEFFNQRKYDFYKIDFDEFRTAYKKCIYPNNIVDEYLENIILIKLNPGYHEKIDTLKLMDGIEDYISGQDRTRKYLYPQRKRNSQYIYGMQCYDGFIDSMRNDNFDFRSSYVFYDRMRLHRFKTECLYKGGILIEEDYVTLIRYSDCLIQRSISAKNFLLKQLLKKRMLNDSDIKRAELKYRELKEIEKEYLILLKKNLQKAFTKVVSE